MTAPADSGALEVDSVWEEDKMSARDRGIGIDRAAILAKVGAVDHGRMIAFYRIEKYVGDFKHYSDIPKWLKPYEVLEFSKNCLLNEGITELWTLACSTGATKWDASNAHLGVGDSASAAVASQTGLLASSNKLYKAMDSPYPIITDQTVTFRSTFTSLEANFAWNEISISNTTDDTGKNLNRKVQAMGTKAEGTTWVGTLALLLA
jgi:hypothetical protein